MVKPSKYRTTQAIVNLNAIKRNIEFLKQQLDEEQHIYATVKADAYGHGAVEVSKAAIDAGATGLAVATVDEAIEIRQAGIIQPPILVLGLTDARAIDDILQYNITITVANPVFFDLAYRLLAISDNLHLLSTYQLNVHLAVDTGMSRIGVTTKEEIEHFAEEVKKYPWVNWIGAFTHFATAGGGPESYIEQQWQTWLALNEALPETVTERHYANSAMGMWYNDRTPKSTIVRYGIAMYGIDPKDALLTDADLKPIERASLEKLEPALELITDIIHIKKVPSGTAISYGATYHSEEEEWIATLGIGYADGWHRNYQTVPVLIDGQQMNVVGTINMDQMMVKLPKYYPVGCIVTLIGKYGEFENHVSQIARETGTIGYEVLTSIGPRVPRTYVSE